MNVLVVGARGNMGQRYANIVTALGHNVLPVDIGDRLPDGWDHAIVATPTNTHFGTTMDLLVRSSKVSILIEKPVCKYLADLKDLYDLAAVRESSLYCVNQYAHLPESYFFNQRYGYGTSWNFKNSGKDGLEWDCFQLFALANGEVCLSNESDVWTCVINGTWINRNNMEFAYGAMINDFLGQKKNVWGREIVTRTTERILAAQ